MRVLVIRNSNLAPLAALGDALRDAGEDFLELAGSELPGHPVPGEQDFTHLVAMGGLESSRGPEPWIAFQRDLMRRWLLEGRAVLGVCLGAQILADALGWQHLHIGERTPEKGCATLLRSATGEARDFLGSASRVFLDHNEGFVVPEAEEEALLARTQGYHQAFVKGRALGVQFHPESTPESAAPWFERGSLPLDRREEIEAFLRSTEHRCQARWLIDFFLEL